MSDQPKPTTGEWTAETVKAMCLYGDYYTTIADAHNAALAAKEKECADVMDAHERKLNRELEKGYNRGRADGGIAYELAMRDNRKLDKELRIVRDESQRECFALQKEIQQLRSQLDDSDMDSASIPAALQPKPTIGDIAMLMCNGGLSESIAAEQQAISWSQQLAAEREKWEKAEQAANHNADISDSIVRASQQVEQQLRAQLAAETENSTRLACELATAVEALKHEREKVLELSPSDWRLQWLDEIDAALAKIQKP